MNHALRQHPDVKYSRDLSSYQIWEVMNNLLREASAPLCSYASMSVEMALSCMSISTKNRRRISKHKNADELLTDLFAEVCRDTVHDEDMKLDLLDVLIQKGIERNIVVDHITFSLQTSKFQHIDRTKLYKHVGVYLDSYDKFKRDVVFRFYYFIQTFANRNHYVKNINGLKCTKDDMFHVYMISSLRAIERFIGDKGTITKYIETWFQNAEGSSDFIVFDNEAFSLNRAVRKEIQSGERDINNKAIPVHDRENTLAAPAPPGDNNFEEYSRLLANLPSSTIVFLAQNLPYHLSAEQIRRIEAHNRAPATKA